MAEHLSTLLLQPFTAEQPLKERNVRLTGPLPREFTEAFCREAVETAPRLDTLLMCAANIV